MDGSSWEGRVMGWAIKRPDGTYRGWNANTQDDTLQPGEVWEALENPPTITSPPRPPNPLIARIDTVLLSTDVPSVLKMLLSVWRTQL